MADSEKISSCWSQNGVFKHYTIDEVYIKKFTIDPKLSVVMKRQERDKLRRELVEGKCKSCKYTSRVHWGNPSNWVRHLKVSCVAYFIFCFVCVLLFAFLSFILLVATSHESCNIYRKCSPTRKARLFTRFFILAFQEKNETLNESRRINETREHW